MPRGRGGLLWEEGRVQKEVMRTQDGPLEVTKVFTGGGGVGWRSQRKLKGLETAGWNQLLARFQCQEREASG